MYDKSVAQLIAGLQVKKFSSVELTVLPRPDRRHWTPYNSFITVDETAVLAAAAAAADERIAAGKPPH